ncbi:alkaline phosphatase [Promicromonospora sp. Populi]|uniref:alkaline phosphatase n=1 Tax=Promicromonospora sp. Populi TaxID=3239420 RepID=UPI0034E238B4
MRTSSQRSVSRRVMAAAAVALAVVAGSVVTTAAATAQPDSNRAKNVIYLVGDGMGRNHVDAARIRYYGADGRLAMETLPVVGQVTTYAIQKNSGQPGEDDFVPEYVTDSASSATAWASGVKSYNAALGVDGKGEVVPTLMELAKDAGYRTGNVSTAEITDATPASQASHVIARGCQGPDYSAAACQDLAITGEPLPTDDVRVTPVADQMARNGTADVVLGGGLARFDAADQEALEAQGYDVLGSFADQTVATSEELENAEGRKVFGLFSRGNLTIEKFKRENPDSVQAEEPSVAELTTEAISLLKGSRKGFYLQVEGALIDKRTHANDAAQALEEMKAFDEAVRVALNFAKKDGNTTVIVTADHETGGFNIVGKGMVTNPETLTPPANVDSGNPANSSTPSRASSGALDPTRSTGPINGSGSSDPGNFAPATFRTADDPEGVEDGSPEASLWLTFLTGHHTGANVPIFAYGPGTQSLAATVDNTDLFDVMGRALRVTR